MSQRPEEQSTHRAGPHPGDIVAGKYRVERVIGQGGMGTVVAASHLVLGEPVALKFLLPMAAQSAKLVERFLREARASARIKSEHVVRVLDVGVLEGGEPFMVMEMLEGVDLGRLIRRRGAIPIPEAAEYIVQACEGIAAAHALGVVHRDLKPANLFLTQRPDGSPLVKVLDFGIAKIVSEADVNLTGTSDLLGSPLYMSPEQIRDPRSADARIDVWALGAILFKLLTGEQPFDATNPSAALAMIVADPPTPLRARFPDAPPALEAIVLGCLEKDPARRVPSAQALAAALGPFAGRPSVLPPAEVTGGAMASVPARASSTVAAPRGWRWAAWVFGAAAATVIGLGLALPRIRARATGHAAPETAQLAPPAAPPAPARAEQAPSAGTAPSAVAEALSSAALPPIVTPSPSAAPRRPVQGPSKPRAAPKRKPDDALDDRF